MKLPYYIKYKDFDFTKKNCLFVVSQVKAKRCPEVHLKYWWFKKYFKKYHKLRKAYQVKVEYEWLNGGYEEYVLCARKIFNLSMDQTYLSVFPPIFNKSKF